MVQAADGGGGGGGSAGPHELKLIQAYRANLESLTKAAQSWTAGADLLNTVAKALDSQAGQLETSFGPNNPTGKAAAERYREVQGKVLKRADEMATASGALEHSRSGLEAAQADHQALPPVTTNPNEPQTDLERLMDPGGGLKQAKYDGERAERERAAGAALTKLDTHFEKSAQDLRTVAGDRPSDGGGGGGGGESGGTGPLSGGGGGTQTVSGVPSGGGAGGKGDPGTVITDSGPRGPRDDGDPGTTPTTAPPGTVPVGGTLSGGADDGYGGSSSGGSSATPTSGSGAGVTSAMGAGVVSGAGAIAASRGGIPVTRAVAAPGSSSGAIGRSASTAAAGAIGRGGSGGMVPGQGSTAGRGGTSGRGAAAGRGGVAAGPGQGQAAKSGGRGGAGTRGRGAAAVAQTGRGKKDEKDVTQDHLAFADEEGWLDDEGASDSVID